MAVAVLLAFVVLHMFGDGDSQKDIIQSSRRTLSPFCIFLESTADTGALGIKVIQCWKYPFPWNHPDQFVSYFWVKKFRHWWRVLKWWVSFLCKSSTRLTVEAVSVFLLEERGGSTSLVSPKKDFFFDIQETRGFFRILRRVWMCLYVFLIAVYKDRILFSLMLWFCLFCRSFIFSDNTESSSCNCIQTVGKY